MKFKKINPKEKIFYVFELSSVKFSIFDSYIDYPIYHGNWNMCESIIKNIKKSNPKVSLYFYDAKKNGLKLSPFWSHNI
jgi:hypothetical protein|tara:strand:+ start:991 stop:1227 length:237 start_codon:yes stop_codon:yes gene_type:complete